MLDIHQLQEQMEAFNAYQAELQAQRADQVKTAVRALRASNEHWQALRDAVDRAQPRQLVAKMRESPARTFAPSERPTPMTVVATDGSQIYPDRHVEPTCYLINVSQVAFQYGTTEPPVMRSTPRFRYDSDDLEDHFDATLGAMTTEVVSALRDEWELRELLAVAREARAPDRPLVAMVDGTLIRWMIRGMRNRSLEQELIRRYTEMLEQFREEALPLCSYISMPGNTEVMHLLQFYLDTMANTDSDVPLDGLMDRKLFVETLAPGERSATFSSASHIQREYATGDKICYFYLRIPSRAGDEIGRVEVPEWVASDPDLLPLVHSVVLSECEKGEGYPMIVTEAHERAVVRAAERELFYRMLEREMQGNGVGLHRSRKQASKRQPRV